MRKRKDSKCLGVELDIQYQLSSQLIYILADCAYLIDNLTIDHLILHSIKFLLCVNVHPLKVELVFTVCSLLNISSYKRLDC